MAPLSVAPQNAPCTDIKQEVSRGNAARDSAPDVRLIAPADDPAAVAKALNALGEASAESPLLKLLGLRAWRRRHYFRLYRLYLDALSHERILYVADGGAAIAIVAPKSALAAMPIPGPLSLWRSGAALEAALMPPRSWLPWLRMLRKLGRSADALAARGVDAGDYLKVIGVATHPSAQGRGLCGAILSALAARADAERRHCWLEAVPGTGVERLYAKYGFEAVDAAHVELPGGAAEFQLMLRRPRGGGSDGGEGGGVSGDSGGRGRRACNYGGSYSSASGSYSSGAGAGNAGDGNNSGDSSSK